MHEHIRNINGVKEFVYNFNRCYLEKKIRMNHLKNNPDKKHLLADIYVEGVGDTLLHFNIEGKMKRCMVMMMKMRTIEQTETTPTKDISSLITYSRIKHYTIAATRT